MLYNYYCISFTKNLVFSFTRCEECSPHLSPANEPSSCCSPLMYSTTLSTSSASTLSYKQRI